VEEPAISNDPAHALLEAASANTLWGKRDRAVLSVFLFHGLRREELCLLKVKDLHLRGGVFHLRVHGKGGRLRYIPAHPGTLKRINDYLDQAGHRDDLGGPLFRPVKNQRSGTSARALASTTVYRRIVKKYAGAVGLNMPGFCIHSLRATAATNALDHASDIAKVQEWLGHANIATTRLYDRRKSRLEDSPTFKVAY
jgi:integrase